MKRNLLIFAVMVAVVLFFIPDNAGAQCPEEPDDLGICDTLYVETFDCDHEYVAEAGSFDSVRVAIYVTHDQALVQDSIVSFVIPLTFWHQPEGCADSVILPHWDNWNNTVIDPADPAMSRSMFRHIVDDHTGDTTYNRLLQMVENGKDDWSVFTDFESHSSDGDSGRCGFSVVRISGDCQKWWEGSRVLLATLTFHVYMSDACDTTEIGIDTTFWPPVSRLAFTRYDAVSYFPRHFLPVKDTIYWIGDNCDNPIIVSLPVELPYSDIGQMTCGRGDDYDNTCLGYYDGGEDIIYELNVTEAILVDITLDPKGAPYTGMALDDACPPGDPCMAYSTSSDAVPHGMMDIDLSPGTYYIMVDTWPSPDCIPAFDLTISEAAPPSPGDNCDDPILISLPAELPYSDMEQTTCGRVDDYDNTCLGYYDGGEDIIYELDVTEAIYVDITLDPKTSSWTGIALDDGCPLDPSTCLYKSTRSGSSPHGFTGVPLEPGTYYIMIDTWPSPNCIPDFDLTISPGSCSEDPNDLGRCDTLYVETFDCDHLSGAEPGSFDSVRVAVYVTHDQALVQDSIRAFVVPLTFWHQPEGCADSVIFPNWDNWNNTVIDPDDPAMSRSMFRHIVDDHTGDTTYNRLLQMVEAGKPAWDRFANIESHSSDGDSGHVFFALIAGPNYQRWWEGSRVLLATLTFHVYMSDACDTTEIGIDTTFWPPSSRLAFNRYDAVSYFPRHFLPVKDTICTGVRWIEGFTEEEGKLRPFSLSQNYPNPFNPVTSFKFTLPHASHVRIEVFNILGQKVRTLVDEDMRAGVFLVDWDGKDEEGVEASSGVYFYRIIAGDFSDIKRMVLLK